MRKSKSRQVVHRSLFCGEGEHECCFINLLKKYYGKKGFLPHVVDCHGGSPKNIAELAVKYTQGRDYAHKALLIDSDKPLSLTDQKRLSRDEGFVIIESNCCIDAEWLKLLSPTSTQSVMKKLKYCVESQSYKDLFHEVYLGGRSRIDVDDLARIFPKIFLDSNRKHNTWLDHCICFIEEDCANQD